MIREQGDEQCRLLFQKAEESGLLCCAGRGGMTAWFGVAEGSGNHGSFFVLPTSTSSGLQGHPERSCPNFFSKQLYLAFGNLSKMGASH